MPIRRDNFIPTFKAFGLGRGAKPHKGPFPDDFGVNKKKYGVEREGFGK